MKTIVDVIDTISDLFTIVASGIAIWIFLFQREKISSAIKLLFRFSFQSTLAELFNRLDKLDDLDLNQTPTPRDEVLILFKEIEGRVVGDEFLNSKLSAFVQRIEEFTGKPSKMIEPKKRRITSELRQHLRGLDISEYHKFIK